jgi:hypothetical protein
MEQSTPENEASVRRVCDLVTAARESGGAVTTDQQIIYDVDYLLTEANSGASFEQYFRWASVDEIGRVKKALLAVDLGDIAQLYEQALQVAFPKGIPSTDAEKSDLTEWSEEQDQALRELFPALEDQNGRITNVLAAYAKRVGA